MPDSGLLQIKASIKILKPAHEVFEAIADPGKMSNYFIASGTGRMEGGKTVTWKFPEFDMEFPVKIGKVDKDRFISFTWTDMQGKDTQVEITLEPFRNDETVVKITEGMKAPDEAGIAWLGQNTEGWANFLACLKAYLEYGINLRKGAFDMKS